MSQFRRCSRPGCGKPAVATLTYAYSESTAVVGPLAPQNEPHSWDLCDHHASRITAPLGWELLRVSDITIDDDDDDITALAKAVREAGGHASGLAPDQPDTTEVIAPRHPARRVPGERRHRHLTVVPDVTDE